MGSFTREASPGRAGYVTKDNRKEVQAKVLGVTPRSYIVVERNNHQTGWLATAWFLWFALASSTVVNAWRIARREDAFFDWNRTSVAIMVGLGAVFGFLAFRVSLRVLRGPQRGLTKPYLGYLGSTTLAMLLAWSLHVFGMVCSLYDTPFVAVLFIFFVPAWLLFLMNVPTRSKVTRWARGTQTP